MTAQILTTIGLLLDIFGVIVLFKYGWPQPDLDDSIKIVTEQDLSNDPAHKAKKRKHKTMAMIGLVALIVGFVLQIIAAWIKSPS